MGAKVNILTVVLVFFLLTGTMSIAGADAPEQQVFQDDVGEQQLLLDAEDAREGGTTFVTMAAQSQNLAGYEAQISFDPSVVQFENASGEDMSDPVTNYDNDEGWVYLTSAEAEGHEDPTLAQLEFSVVGAAGDATELEFEQSETLVNDEEPVVYEATTETLSTQGDRIDVAEAGTAAGADGDGGDDGTEGTDDGTGDGEATDGESGGESNPDEGMSTVTIALLTFAAGAVLMGALMGAFIYGMRRGKQQTVEHDE